MQSQYVICIPEIASTGRSNVVGSLVVESNLESNIQARKNGGWEWNFKRALT
jgi:hypothetical protein